MDGYGKRGEKRYISIMHVIGTIDAFGDSDGNP